MQDTKHGMVKPWMPRSLLFLGLCICPTNHRMTPKIFTCCLLPSQTPLVNFLFLNLGQTRSTSKQECATKTSTKLLQPLPIC